MKRIILASAIVTAMTGSAFAIDVCSETKYSNENLISAKNKIDLCFEALVKSRGSVFDRTCHEATSIAIEEQGKLKAIAPDLLAAAYDESRKTEVECATKNMKSSTELFKYIGAMASDINEYAEIRKNSQ